jgi:hypothetical protein
LDKLIIVFLAGVLVGTIIYAIAIKTASVGTLRIDQSDPEDSPYLFLELEKNLSVIAPKKYVIMKVELKNYISHD